MAKDERKYMRRLRELMSRDKPPKAKAKSKAKKLRELLTKTPKAKKKPDPMKLLRQVIATPVDEVVIVESGRGTHLVEGKWLAVNFDKEIRVDRNTHMRTGEKHAHLYDRKGNQMYALTQDGRLSHNSKPFKLDNKQAEALRGEGFTIPRNRIVEAVLIGKMRMIIFG